MPVRFHRAAIAEAVSARDWYDRVREGLGTSFAEEVERVVNLIEQYPSRFPFHTDGMRRASLRRFPFSVFFEEAGDVIYVWAVFHHRRDPSTIEQRRS
jgi:plasmid stabilization system protein ParE